MRLFPTIFIFLSACSTTTKAPCINSPTSFQCVEYVRNYDADTVTFNIKGTHPLLGERIGIRVDGVDTPELRTKDICEKRLSKKAQKRVQFLLENSKRIDLEDVKRGKYFRIVASVKIDGRDLKQILLDEGFAYPYDGGTKRKVDWCKFQESKQ